MFMQAVQTCWQALLRNAKPHERVQGSVAWVQPPAELPQPRGFPTGLLSTYGLGRTALTSATALPCSDALASSAASASGVTLACASACSALDSSVVTCARAHHAHGASVKLLGHSQLR